VIDMAEKRVEEQKILKALEEIKKLFILQLRTKGVTSEDIAQVLGIDSSGIRRMVSIRRIKKTSGKVS